MASITLLLINKILTCERNGKKHDGIVCLFILINAISLL